MAEIYNPQVQEIGLTGLNAGGQFNPVQVFNPAQQILQAGQQQVESYSKDLEALVGFSKTLADYSQQRFKQYKEDEYNLGIADIMNGDAQISPDIIDRHRNNAQILQSAAEADGRVANEFAANGQLDVSQQFKEKSAAISGWRAYGQAVQLTKNAANESSGFFQSFIKRKEAIVPIPNGDGTFTMMAPNQLSSPEQIKAGLAIAQQELIQQQGIGRINPVILAEHFAPTLQAVKGQVQANQLSEAARRAEETAVDTINGNLRSDFSNPDLTVEGMSETFQRSVTAYEIDGRMSKGNANTLAIKEALDTIATMPPDVAEDMLTKLSQVRKIANDPNSLTLGSAYAGDFAETLDKINGKIEQAEAAAERKLGKQAEQAWGLLKKAEQDATMPAGELQALRKQTIGVLGQLADQGSTDALKYRTELLSDPINVDYTLYRQYREGIAQGKRPSQEQIQRDVQSGKLTTEMGRELGVYATSSDQGDFKKQFGPSISDAVKAKLKGEGAISLDPFNRPETNVLHVEQVTNDLVANVYRWRQSQIAKGQTPDDNDINQFVINELPRTIGKYFQYNPNTKAWTTRPLSRNPSLTPNQIKSSLSGPVRDASGFNPRTIQLRSYNSGSTVIMSKAEVEDNIQRMASNQPMTRRAEQLANSQGGPVQLLTNQAKHYGIDTKPILSSPEAQRLSQYSAAAPWATQRYNAAGGNYRQQMFQLQRIVEAQARAANAGKGPGPAVDVKSGSAVGTKDLVKLGLSQGLTPEKAITMAAVALGESAGQPWRQNNNRSTGDNSYGLWQINMIDALGPERARALGLKNYDQLKDPNVNAKAMKYVLDRQGLTAWSVYRNRLHLPYLPEARRAYAELKREM